MKQCSQSAVLSKSIAKEHLTMSDVKGRFEHYALMMRVNSQR